MGTAGLSVEDTYLTNAVKHFKFEQRGKRRLHVKPTIGEIKACHLWLAEELRLVRPKLVLALGATAARAVLGRTVTIAALRGRPLPLIEATHAWVTVHPSYLLRIPDETPRRAEYARFVRELEAVNAWLQR